MSAVRPLLFDTHAHLISDDWERYPPRALRADLPMPKRTPYDVTAEALIAQMDAHGVPVACVVQRGHLYGYDNSYIIDAAQSFPERLLPVVVLDTQDPQVSDRYADLVRNHRVRGVRMANTRPAHLDTAWMSSPTALQLWQRCADLGTPVTLIFFQNQLCYALPLLRVIAKMFPALPILIDHLGTVYGATQVELAWAREAGIDEQPLPPPPGFGIEETIRIFEDTPNVHFKLTEVNMERLREAGVTPALLVRRMVDCFGAGRLVWGSDVGQSLRWSYAEKAAMARDAASLLDAAETQQFCSGNAARIHGWQPG